MCCFVLFMCIYIYIYIYIYIHMSSVEAVLDGQGLDAGLCAPPQLLPELRRARGRLRPGRGAHAVGGQGRPRRLRQGSRTRRHRRLDASAGARPETPNHNRGARGLAGRRPGLLASRPPRAPTLRAQVGGGARSLRLRARPPHRDSMGHQ